MTVKPLQNCNINQKQMGMCTLLPLEGCSGSVMFLILPVSDLKSSWSAAFCQHFPPRHSPEPAPLPAGTHKSVYGPHLWRTQPLFLLSGSRIKPHSLLLYSTEGDAEQKEPPALKRNFELSANAQRKGWVEVNGEYSLLWGWLFYKHPPLHFHMSIINHHFHRARHGHEHEVNMLFDNDRQMFYTADYTQTRDVFRILS